MFACLKSFLVSLPWWQTDLTICLTCLGPQCTGGAPVHPLHYGVPPTSHQTPAGTEAETLPSWRSAPDWSCRSSRSARRLQTGQSLKQPMSLWFRGGWPDTGSGRETERRKKTEAEQKGEAGLVQSWLVLLCKAAERCRRMWAALSCRSQNLPVRKKEKKSDPLESICLTYRLRCCGWRSQCQAQALPPGGAHSVDCH